MTISDHPAHSIFLAAPASSPSKARFAMD